MPRRTDECPCVFPLVVKTKALLFAQLTALVACLPLSFSLLISFSNSVHAQSATSTLSGVVIDENGAVISGANIAVISIAQGFQRTADTNEEGSFVVSLLPPGNYTVKVEHEGFTPAEFRDVVLNVNDQRTIKITLKVGKLASQRVDVLDSPTLLDESSAVGTTVDREFVENLPLNGRSFQSLITLTPGVVLTKASASNAGQFSVNGQRADSNYFTIDGVSANISASGSLITGQAAGGALPGFSATGGTNNLVSVDALQEFKVQTSTYAPEFGRMPGAQVQILTRSGTNNFHGSLFNYLRNEVFDANDWFANTRPLTAQQVAQGLTRQKRTALRQNDFGGVLGGPILLPHFGEGGQQPGYNGRNRTFFFFSYEGLRLRLPTTATTLVPSLTARQNAPASIRAFLNAFPTPTGAAAANGLAEFTSSYSNPSSLDAASIRLDHRVNDRLSLFGRYSYSPSESVTRGGSFSLNSLNTTAITTQTLTAGATFIINQKIFNELRANYSRNNGHGFRYLDEFGGAAVPADSVLFPSFASSQNAQTSFTILGGTQTAFLVGTIADNLQRQMNLVDNLAVATGNHQLKFGIDYRRLSPVYAPRLYSQLVSFSGIGITAPGVPAPSGSVLSGRVSSGSVNAESSRRFPVFTNFSAYGQDTWRPTSRLTLTYGLRWEYNPPPSEAAGNDPFTLTGLDNPATFALASRGTPLYKTTYTNFAPRLGVAYKLFQTPGRETVLRGGFGIFYDLGTGAAGEAFAGFPYTARKTLSPGTPFPLSDSLATPPTPVLNPPIGVMVVFDPNLELPRTYQSNFTIEQSLGANQSVSASYLGAAGRRLLRQERTFPLRSTPPNTNFTDTVDVIRNAATSDYHAMQLQFQRRLSGGLQALASYTWSKSLDIASDDASSNTPSGRLDPQTDRGPSDFDVRHAFNAAMTYNIPTPSVGKIGSIFLRNFAVDAIFTARSATPVNVIISRDIGFGGFGLRPDLIPGIPLYIDDPTAPGGRRFNDSAVAGNVRQRGPFLVPTEGRQGTLGRNSLRGFPVYQVDLSIRRQFNFTERVNLLFKTEFFNIFNHPNFGDPIGALGSVNSAGVPTFSPLFGRSRTMLGSSLGSGGVNGGFNPLYQIGGPRSIQFALKLQF